MSTTGVSLLTVAVIAVSLCGFVLLRSPREVLTRAFAYFLLCGAVWAVSIAGVIHSPPLPFLKAAGQCAFAAGVLSISGFYAFVLIFPSPVIPPDRRRMVWLVYALGAVGAALGMTALVFRGPDFSTSPPQPVPGPLFAAYAALCLLLVIGALAELFLKLVRTSKPRERVQLSYLIAGGVLSFVGSVVLVFVLPALGNSEWATLAPLSILGMVGGAALAITKHRLFHLGIVFRQVLIGLGVAVVLTLLISVLLTLSRSALGDDPVLVTVGLVATAAVAGLLLPVLRRIIEAGVDAFIFGGPPTDTRALRRLSQELTTLLSVDPMARLLVSGIGHALRLRHVSLYMAEIDGHESDAPWSVRAAWPPEHPALPDLPAGSPLVGLVRAHNGPMVIDLPRQTATEARHDLRKQQAMLDAEVVVPLKAEGETLGVLVLSEKSHGDLLSEMELGLLATLAHQASTALANAMLHEEIVRMKVHNDNVLRAMVSGVIAVDRHGTLTTCNRRAAEMLGRPSAAVLGRDELTLPPALGEPLRDARLFGRTVRRFRVDLPCADGTTISVSLLANGMRDASGNTIGALIVFEDLTERLRLEEQLRRADRLASLGTLAAGLAHEIKNPLVSIRTLAQLLPSRFHDPEFRDTFAQLAGGEVERINDLVERLLVFARPSPPSLEWLHLEPIVNDVLQLMRVELAAHGVDVAREYGAARVWVYADAAQMRQILLNLFMNALDAMRDAPTRRLTVQLSDGPGEDSLRVPEHWTQNGDPAPCASPPQEVGRLTLVVGDTGPGIPEELRDEVFNPFFTTKAQGSGLGLAVVGRIVREHGGAIAVERNAAGGANLVVHFPAAIAIPEPAPVS